MRRYSLLALFFLTGFSALIYEICWVRQATLIFGVSIFAYSAVLTAYMGGMAIGSYLVGRWVDRSANPLRLLAGLQVALAVLGVLALAALTGLKTLYSLVASDATLGLTALTALRLGMALLAMTPPAICIGAMMPAMSRIYAQRTGLVGHEVGQVYAVNTLGSVLGCAFTAIFFIRLWGLRETVFLAAALNLIGAAIAWRLPREGQESDRPRRSPRSARRPAVQDQTPTQRRFVLWAYACSGFASLGYEVVWARIISLHTLGAIYSFSIMLAVFLSGLFVGGLLGAWWVRRRQVSVLHFGSLQAGIGVLAGLALLAFAQLPHLRLESLSPQYTVTAEIAFEGLLSFLTLFPVTVLMGAVFPVVSSLYTAEQTTQVGLKIGQVMALNTAGSILGSLLTGFVIVPVLGLQRSALALATLNLGIGAAAIWFLSAARPRMRWMVAAASAATAAAAIALPPTQYLGYWQDMAADLIFYREGVETTVAVFEASSTNPKFSTVNGRVEVPTDVLSLRAFYLLGHLPAILRPDAHNALMLSFGNGIATGALSTHHIPAVEVVELSPEMVEAAQVYAEENRHVLDYPGLLIHVEDARNFLLQTSQSYDIITTDATHPANSSSWTLFTVDFYRQVKAHLAPAGVFVQWVPLHSMAVQDYLSILRTFQSVFPTATLWYAGGSHTLLLATPETLTEAHLEERLQAASDHPAVLQDLGEPQEVARHWIMNEEQLREFAGPGEIVQDNQAFFLPINAEMAELIQIIQLAAVRANP